MNTSGHRAFFYVNVIRPRTAAIASIESRRCFYFTQFSSQLLDLFALFGELTLQLLYFFVLFVLFRHLYHFYGLYYCSCRGRFAVSGFSTVCFFSPIPEFRPQSPPAKNLQQNVYNTDIGTKPITVIFLDMAAQHMEHMDKNQEDEMAVYDEDIQRRTRLAGILGVLRNCAKKRRLGKPWYIVAVLIVLALVVVWTEGYCRRNWPDSPRRPSRVLTRFADFAKDWFFWFGWQLARLLDLYELVRDFILDTGTLACSAIKVIVSPLAFVDGWVTYFKGLYDNYMVVLTIAGLLVALAGAMIATRRSVWHNKRH